MENCGLRLVKSAPIEESGGSRKAWTLALGLLLLAAWGVATSSGADEARRRFDARGVAGTALDISLVESSRSAGARSRLTELRTVVARRPLDTATRAVYASLLLSLSSGVDQLQAPAFHARVAAELSPVTVPVVGISALVLNRAGETAEGQRLARLMFDYDPESAASLLAQMEPLLAADRVAETIPDSPRAWLAWERELRNQQRAADAAAVLEEAYRRWPTQLEIVERVAAGAVRRKDWMTLRSLFRDDREIPGITGSPTAVAYRAVARATVPNREGAIGDIRDALRLGGDSAAVLSLVGDAWIVLGEPAEARRLWNRALFAAGSGDRLRRLSILLRLARLEQEHGEPAAALRRWRSVLELEPDHEEARRRVEELTGLRR